MLNSKGAEDFAIEQGVEKVSQDWLITDLRKAQWQKWKDNNSRPGSTDEDDEAILDHDAEGLGTVGAVAIDSKGNLAAATSTGGMTGKPDGRIGDTPIIGAGTWADKLLQYLVQELGRLSLEPVLLTRYLPDYN